MFPLGKTFLFVQNTVNVTNYALSGYKCNWEQHKKVPELGNYILKNTFANINDL